MVGGGPPFSGGAAFEHCSLGLDGTIKKDGKRLQTQQVFSMLHSLIYCKMSNFIRLGSLISNY